MSKWSRDNLLTLILAGVTALLLIGVAIESAVLEDKRSIAPVSSEKASNSEATETVDAEDVELPDIQEYEAIVQRPLFMEGRRPGAEGGETTATTAQDTPLTVKLMGVAFSPSDKTALFVDAKGKYKRLKKNGSIDGWTLVDFGQDRVTLQQGDEQRELMLLKPKPKTAPGQPQQTPQQPAPPPRPVTPPPPPVEEISEEAEVIEEEETVDEEAVTEEAE
ncbi:hypothetical protein [Methylocaldum sp.]|uniref:hypothetical protein n=1 Tax=Methylocaldum sp. TaxID=1969727 RepID=UPI002D2DCA7B|nr:hypothetical protein [Methylocaldum sp.]HYE36183.1 hypothetical protein [Methylocaldum sp.]